MTDKNVHYGRRVAVLAAASGMGATGGAERFYTGLRDALAAQGCEVDLIAVPADESTFASIIANYDRCRYLDVSSYDLVISTKAPTYAVRHSRHIVYLVHTVRVFYDMFDQAFPAPSPELLQHRQQIQSLDTAALGSASYLFAIGHEVASRLRRWNRLNAEVLHPPLVLGGFRRGSQGDFFFLPGRLHPWKRVDLAIRAVKASSSPLRLLIAGTGEAEADLRRLAGSDRRIQFLGRVSDEELVDYYAGCLAVVFLPLREDYGYVTLEAFSSAKPVITCRDSGEPLQFVSHERTGWICDPTTDGVREAMEYCLAHRDVAKRWGESGAAAISHITWPNVARRLLAAGFDSAGRQAAGEPNVRREVKVAVLDMQPIDPPVGGGRLRLLGLYHAMGDNIRTRYVGTYDWPGESYRQHHLTSGLEEIDVPLSDAHHAAARRLSAEAGGKVVIDLAFPRHGHLSADYVAAARDAIEWADVVIFSHPWVYPLVAERVRSAQLVVYDSHNVEGFLRAQLLDSCNPTERALLREVVAAEYEVGTRADFVLACSPEDKQRFARIYEWPFRKMRVLPNGVMASWISVPTADERRAAKRSIGVGLDKPLAIFIGSPYGPNVEAARFIANALAPALPDLLFVIAGGVGSVLAQPMPSNVICTGSIDEQAKLRWLKASDFGVNPMFSGSGTNIKMFDLMAAGLPIVTTAVGARGISSAGRRPFVVVQPSTARFVEALRRLMADVDEQAARSRDARACVEDGYSWERISPHLGQILLCRLGCISKPYFSVVVPSFDRHEKLVELMECLERQTERSFEVVVVDQSPVRWAENSVSRSFPLTYIHTDVRGAVRARNTGADCAQGTVIAFTDDDCLPDRHWLSSARAHFDANDIVGIEGYIESDHLDDPAYRPVTNVGFEGIGFMTANLFVRTEDFHQLDGFDEAFDLPHFREDTDFGWRLQSIGEVPYARDVKVFHPAQPRHVERESSEVRAKFFEKDALLLAKHPARYRELFELERHWQGTPGFWEHFKRGAELYGVNIEDYLQFYDRGLR
jgi:glycosyltransferase involved in cell wall biosynthesis/GT2 family glycosyltransferase